MPDGSDFSRSPRKENFDIGYGKPPKDTQFKPGQSGNPRGRPRGSKNKKGGIEKYLEEQFDQIVLDECYREISIRDGDRLIKMPVVQATMRNVALKAAKGDPRCQRLLADHLQRVEGKKKAVADDWTQTVLKHKAEGEAELARRKKLGIEGPPIYPHPDDIEINFATGEIRILGPWDKSEKDYVDTVVFKTEIEEKIDAAEKEVARKPKSKMARDHLEALLNIKARIEERLANHPGGGRFR